MTIKLYRILILPLAVGALLAAGACSSKDEETSPNAHGEARSLEITAEEYKFTPSQITASPGERLTITFYNKGKLEHSIRFDLPDKQHALDRNVAPGMTGHLSFTAPSKAGSYDFYSPVDDDRKKGREGKLDVHTTGTTKGR